jgi:hypothetical protein
MGKRTRRISPVAYIYDTHVCFFNGLASSGQLGTRSTVVSHVFDFDPDTAGGSSLDSSTMSPSTCLRNGFQCESAVTPIVPIALRVVTRSDRKQ